MQLVRNGFVIVLLIGVGYAVYTYVNKPAPTPPPGIDLEMPELALDPGSLSNPGAEVDLGKAFPGSATGANVGQGEPARLENAPPAQVPPPGDEAPPFNPNNNSPSGTSTSSTGRAMPNDLDPPAAGSRNADRVRAEAVGFEGQPGRGGPIADAAAPNGSHKFADAWQQGQRLLADNRLVEALSLLSPWYGDRDLLPNESQQLEALLGQLAGTVIYSSNEHLLEPPYIVHDGETLRDIAQQYKVPQELLAKINNVKDPNSLRPGDRIKVVRGPFDAVLDLSRKEIALQIRGNYAGRFKVVRSGVTSAQYKQASSGLKVKEKMNARGEHLVGLDNQLGIYAEDYSQNALKMPNETSIVLSAQDAEDVYDILTLDSLVTIAP